ncbi:MAG: hypothetical protein QGG42_08365 [Phycisphaerae bacterium]|jgi:hypothetical protein|nr:hypothetical protein [Phycisphaerae bacterium]
MKTLNQLICLFVVAIASTTWAQDAKPKPAVKIVKETKIFKLDDSRDVRENAGMHSMRLSPDGKTLLYMQQIPQANKQTRRGYRLLTRDIKTGKDAVMPGAPSGSDDFLVAYISMRPFDAAGKNLVIPVGVGQDNEPVQIGKGQMQLGSYNLATGKHKKLDLTAPVVFPSYDAAGKNLIVFAMFTRDGRPDMPSSKIVISAVDKIKFKQISVVGMPRSPCPAGDLLPVLLPPNRQDPNVGRKAGFVLYDTKADKQLLMLPIQSGNKLDDYNPQWTADGRYLYYVDSENDAGPDGRMRRKSITRIWDRKKAVEHAILEGVIPVGPAPDKSAMILKPEDGGCKIHNPATAKTTPLLSSETRIINADGRFLLYVKTLKDGSKSVYRAEIK